MKKIKKVPLRQCIACKSQKSKRELLRIVRNPDGVLLYDPKGKMSGRGAYLCVSSACLQRAVKNRLFLRHLQVDLDPELLAKLESLIGDDPDED
jgi:hypothetical protein